MRIYEIEEAQEIFEELIEKVANGEVITIGKNGTPLANLVLHTEQPQ